MIAGRHHPPPPPPPERDSGRSGLDLAADRRSQTERPRTDGVAVYGRAALFLARSGLPSLQGYVFPPLVTKDIHTYITYIRAQVQQIANTVDQLIPRARAHTHTCTHSDRRAPLSPPFLGSAGIVIAFL